jgi:5-formyltetrahydrofolate cyclo-ligase
MNRTDKRSLRKDIRAEIAKLTTEEKQSLSAQIFSKLADLDEVCKASVVALFVSLADEPQTAEIIEQLLQKNKRVVVPRIEGEEMNFYDISEGVEVGAFGIMEPSSKRAVEPSEIDVMVVPGVVFTLDGARCGRGKGFYDKYLASKGFRAYTIGVCYPCQIVKTLPTEEHDKMLDCVISI